MKKQLLTLVIPLLLIANLAIVAHAEPTTDKPLLTPCGLTETQLEAALLHDLKPYAGDFLQAESDTGINAIFLASVAALESGWGRYEAAPNNIYGWTSQGGYMAFDSVEECISYVAQRLKTNYLSPDGCYFSGYDVKDVNRYYNGSEAWETLVKQIMGDIEGRAAL